jgi:hypothetical protein
LRRDPGLNQVPALELIQQKREILSIEAGERTDSFDTRQQRMTESAVS